MKLTVKAAALFLLLFGGTVSAGQAEYTFGIVPQQSAAKIAKLWGPILKRVGEQAGVRLKLVTAKNIPTFEQRLAAGEYDFAYMNPYHFTVFHQSPGYQAFAKQRDKTIRGIIVVRRDSDIETFDDMSGSTLAFPSPAAFAASILTRAGLDQRNIPFTPRYVSSHDSVYLAVARGLLPAGGGVVRTFNNTDPAVRDQLRIFWKTPKYTPHAFASHPEVSPDHRQAVADALKALGQTPEGLALLKGINFKGIEAASNSDWDDVRSLQISELDD